MIINYLQHVAFENLGNIADWARARAHETRATRLFAGEKLPNPDEIDFLLILGGSMNVDEEAKFPFLAEEKKFIEQAVKREIPVLGICLGAQLVADVLGARVYRNEEKEIGWFSIEKSIESQSPFAEILPASFVAFHWHGDTFDLPAAAERRASSAACRNQAFAYGDKVLGLQFHPEATAENVRLMTQNEADEIRAEIAAGAKFVQTAEQILLPENPFAENATIMRELLDALAEKGNRGNGILSEIK